MLCLLLKAVQDVNNARELYCVNRPERVSVEIVNHFQNASSAEPLEWFGRYVLATQLRLEKSEAHRIADFLGKALKAAAAVLDPNKRSWRRAAHLRYYANIGMKHQEAVILTSAGDLLPAIEQIGFKKTLAAQNGLGDLAHGSRQRHEASAAIFFSICLHALMLIPR